MKLFRLKKKSAEPIPQPEETPVPEEMTEEIPAEPDFSSKSKHKFVLTYRAKRRLRGLGITLAVLAVTGAVGFVCWFTWLGRFVVYSADGARLDFEGSFQAGEPQEVVPPNRPVVDIYYNEGDQQVETSYDLTQIQARYVTGKMLSDYIGEVDQLLTDDPARHAVMLDLKSPFGSLYYNSAVDPENISSRMDTAAVEKLIKKLDGSGVYLIARIPAFRDYAYGLEHVGDGLSVPDGSHLWADEESCYWLNPTSTNVLSRLISFVSELRSMGFDEVVFENFSFPDTDQLEFDGDRNAAIAKAAETLVSSCATDRFAVSFQSSDPDFPMPAGRSRLYLTDIVATGAKAAFDACAMENPETKLVFLTESSDTRFDISSVARPLPVGDFLTVETEPTETTEATEESTEPSETEETEETEEDSDDED